jgi:hypothetical protein
MDTEITSQIENANWDELYPILILFAQTRLRHALKTNGNPVIEGLDANVLLDQAIDKTLDGTRKWKYKNISLEDHLKGVIRSDVSSFFKKDISKSVVTIQAENETVNAIETVGDQSSRPDIKMFRAEEEALLVHHLAEFKASITSDKELSQILETYDAGFTKPKDIADLTGLDPRRIDELKRKLLTKYLRFTERCSGVQEQTGLIRRPI